MKADAGHRSGFEGAAQDEIKVLQLTDAHLQSEPGAEMLGVDTERSLQQVLQLARTEHGTADLAVATGDLVQDGSTAGYRRLKEYLSRLGVPVYCLSGNHDDPETLARILSGGQVRSQRTVAHRGWQLVFLNSAVLGRDGGRLADSELEHLAQLLARHPDQHIMICLHHPPVRVGSEWMDTMALENADALFALTDRHPQVRAIVWGHAHQEYDDVRNGVRLLGAPSTCFQFKPFSRTFALDQAPPGYRWMVLRRDGGVETGVRRLTSAPETLDFAAKGY